MSKRYFGSIRQRASGRWQIRYRLADGSRVAYPQTYARKADAARVLSELERQFNTGTAASAGSGAKIKFGAYAEQWLTQHPGLRPRTADVYRSMLRRHLLPSLGEVPLGRLDTAAVKAWRAGMASRGVSPTMIAKCYRLLRAVLNTALAEDGLIASNPCKIKGAGEERSAERPVLTVDQVYELASLVPDRWRAFILLKTFASLRWGEITALTRADLDLSSRTVHVRRQFVSAPGGLQVGPPKSRAGLRVVSFPAAILPELQHHLDTYSGHGSDGLVFPNEHGKPFQRGNFDKAVPWAAIREQLGVPGLHLHDLRHTGNTLASQTGASLKDLMARMGHDSPAAALIYQHASRAADEAIASALDVRLAAQRAKAESATRSAGGARVGPGENEAVPESAA